MRKRVMRLRTARRGMAKAKPGGCMREAYAKEVAKAAGTPCVAEHRFHPTRRWRFDYALPEAKVAIEIDGGVWTYGRHNRAAGYIADMEKLNEAARLGWRVLRYTTDEQWLASTFMQIADTCGAGGKDTKPPGGKLPGEGAHQDG